jgi:hypothetical protein
MPPLLKLNVEQTQRPDSVAGAAGFETLHLRMIVIEPEAFR